VGLRTNRGKRQFRVYVHHKRNVFVSLLDPSGDERNDRGAMRTRRASSRRAAVPQHFF
jgi:hypothetical protein